MTDSQPAMQQSQAGLTPGAILRQAREAGGLSHAAVGEALHLTVHYIKSLENDEYHKLPGLIFVKGYIKSYARLLKLDVESLLAGYEHQIEKFPEVKSHTLAGNYTRKRNDQAIGWAIAATLVILIGLGAGWWFFGRHNSEVDNRSALQNPSTPPASRNPAVPVTDNVNAAGPAVEIRDAAATATSDSKDNAAGETAQTPTAALMPAPANSATPAASASSTATASGNPAATVPAPATRDSNISVTPSPTGGRQINLVNPGPDHLQLNFSSDSWIEVDGAGNARLYAELLHTGDVLTVTGQAPFQVLLGDGHAVKASFNSTPLNISSSMRPDNTARLTVANPATSIQPLANNSVGLQSGTGN